MIWGGGEGRRATRKLRIAIRLGGFVMRCGSGETGSNSRTPSFFYKFCSYLERNVQTQTERASRVCVGFSGLEFVLWSVDSVL